MKAVRRLYVNLKHTLFSDWIQWSRLLPVALSAPIFSLFIALAGSLVFGEKLLKYMSFETVIYQALFIFGGNAYFLFSLSVLIFTPSYIVKYKSPNEMLDVFEKTGQTKTGENWEDLDRKFFLARIWCAFWFTVFCLAFFALQLLFVVEFSLLLLGM